MTTFRIQAPASGDGDWDPQPQESSDPSVVLGVVREDIRQTLRMGWIDPALDAVAAQPVFFTAAWSAIRPNVGKSFQVLARALRAEASETVRSNMDLPDLRKRLATSPRAAGAREALRARTPGLLRRGSAQSLEAPAGTTSIFASRGPLDGWGPPPAPCCGGGRDGWLDRGRGPRSVP